MKNEHTRREQFYSEMSETQKTEFINGEVIVHSPAKLHHTIVCRNLLILLSTYVQKHALGLVGHEKMLITLTRNDYEPDVCYFRQEKAQHFSPQQMKFPAPDFVVEILSPSTEINDRGVKFEDYAFHGVREYWLVDPEQEFVEQYLLKDEVYQPHVKVMSGEIASVAIPGFVIPVRAVFDEAEQFTALQTLLKRV
jgi:Uma2 family endonuclease